MTGTVPGAGDSAVNITESNSLPSLSFHCYEAKADNNQSSNENIEDIDQIGSGGRRTGVQS